MMSVAAVAVVVVVVVMVRKVTRTSLLRLLCSFPFLRFFF
jgi:hypothetical protein